MSWAALRFTPRPWSDEIFGHHFSLGAGMLKIDEDQLSGSWHTTDYEVGDALIIHSLTVHKALPNETDEHIRISLDNRYQSASDVINDRQLQPHLSGGGTRWGWDSKSTRNGPTTMISPTTGTTWRPGIVPWDDGFADKGVMDAIAKARNGDEDAIYSLNHLAQGKSRFKVGGTGCRNPGRRVNLMTKKPRKSPVNRMLRKSQAQRPPQIRMLGRLSEAPDGVGTALVGVESAAQPYTNHVILPRSKANLAEI